MSDAKPITWVELAKRLGYSRAAIYLWREMEGAPETTDLVQWQAFIEQHGLGNTGTKSLTELKAAVEAEKLRKLRRENEVAEGQLLRREVLGPYLRGRASTFARLCRVTLEQELPPRLQGANISEIRATMREAVDSLIHRYNTTFDAERIASEATAEND